MKNRFSTLVAISVFGLLAFTLAACEKDRPVPTPTRSASSVAATAAAAAATRAPQANATQLALPVVSGGATVTGTQDSTAGTPQATTADATQQPTAGSNGQSFTYTVAQGDSLTSLAKKFGVTQESILTLNGLTNPDALKAGQTLKIPGQGTTATGTSTTGGATTYTVKAGDTLSKIAVKFGVTTKQLVAANNITNPDVLPLGKVLTIPASGTTTGTSTGTTTGTSGAKTYVVQPGDTMAQIAARNGVTLSQLMAANNITNADKIYSGQTLKIP